MAQPAFLTEFVGRRHESREVLDAVRSRSLVTIVGTGGLGKTRLAARVLDLARPELGDRVWAAELADLRDPALVGHVVSAAVEAPSPGEVFDPAPLATAIGDGPGLLLIDNAEHLLEACAELVSALLGACRGLTVLVTSRQALGVVGEYVYPIPLLAERDAIDLFCARAGASLSGWALTDANRADVVELCAALEGIPLAIELIAPWVRAYPPATLTRNLADQLVRLGTARGGPARMTSLDASMRWSHELCASAEQVLWHRLSVFAGGFSLAAAEEACTGDGLEQGDVFAALAGLVEKSVVLRSEADGRYRMLEQVRQFGLARLAEDDDPFTWRKRHRDHYLALAESFAAGWWGPDQGAWMARLHLERRNLAVAFELSAASPDEAPCVLRMSPLLEHFFAATGGGGEALRWLGLARLHGTGTDLERAEGLRIGSFIANLTGELETSAAFHADLVALADTTGSPGIRARALYAESQLRTFQGDLEAGIAAADEGTALLRDLGEIGLEANLHFLYGMILGWADQPDVAAHEYKLCVDILEPRGELWLTSYSQWGIGVDALMAGKVDLAISVEREALRAKVAFGDQLGIGLTMEALAWAASDQGRGRDAAFLIGGASAIWDRIGMTVAAMPSLSRRRASAIQATRDQLTPGPYDDLVALGREASLEQLVATALGSEHAPARTAGQPLTRREREVAELVAGGASNKAIADHLVISVRTVETHVENVLRKLGVAVRAEVASALR